VSRKNERRNNPQKYESVSLAQERHQAEHDQEERRLLEAAVRDQQSEDKPRTPKRLEGCAVASNSLLEIEIVPVARGAQLHFRAGVSAQGRVPQ